MQVWLGHCALHGRMYSDRAILVRVSGVAVTVTAFDGSFSIAPAGPFVFCCRPAGWRCDPWYVPAAAGDGITFTLVPAAAPLPYRFVHTSDLHMTSGTPAGQEGWLRADLQAVPPGTAWILLSHDQPSRSFLRGLLVPGLDGHLYTLRARTGQLTGDLDLAVPVAAPVVVADDLALALGVDGTLLALDLKLLT
jgi:outer membrane protein assembly factor BamB